MQNRFPKVVLIIIATLLSVIAIYNIPFVHDRLAWRVEDIRASIFYYFNPPDEAVFIPNKNPQVDVATSTPSPAPTATQSGVTLTPIPTLVPTITPTTIPESVILKDVKYVDQFERWNYCGPANLTMALNYVGWAGNRDQVAAVVKPGYDNAKENFIERGKLDKNVMPYELADFVNEHTEYRALIRHGGDLELLKRLIAAGFPMIVEKGYYERDYSGKVAWLGHYIFTTGYDDLKGEFVFQDSYPPKDATGKSHISGKDRRSKYEEFLEGWRSFNYILIIVYQPEREAELMKVLGLWADPLTGDKHALEISTHDTQFYGAGNDAFFAWFNKGTSYVQLQEYGEAATAYDRAFSIYAQLGTDDKQRPYRMMWYQTGPYWAYYYSGRYQDVIDLANTTLNETVSVPALEESLYWRGLAEAALGDTTSAIKDLKEALRLNPNFQAARQQLDLLTQP